MILSDDQVRALARALIDERYESQAQAARTWGLRPQTLNNALQGRIALPGVVLDKLGLERVIMYRRK